MKKHLLFAALSIASCTGMAEIIATCDVGPGPTLRVQVVREMPIADTWIYSLRQKGKTTPLFSDADTSRGSLVEVTCVGKKNHALVVSGEFAANSRQGFVLTYRPGRSAPGRLDFAEKGTPDWLFLNKSETIVAITTNGLGENSGKYRMYRTTTGMSAEPAAESVDRLPRAKGFEKVNLKTSGRTTN